MLLRTRSLEFFPRLQPWDPLERAYSQAREIADKEAVAESVRNDTEFATADTKAFAPNYPPAQLLYAYAIENVLKGLMVFKRPDLVQEHELHGELKTHDLNELAKKAKVTVEQRERPVLEVLTNLSTWAGSYPIARGPSDETPNMLLPLEDELPSDFDRLIPSP